MSTELGKAYVQIMPTAKGISNSIKNEIGVEGAKSGKSFGTAIIGAAKKILVGAAIGKIIGESVKEGAKLQQSIGGIETIFKDSSKQMIKYANEAYKTAGISANTYMEQATSFGASLLQATGGNAAKAAEAANQAIIDMADNANKMGTPLENIQTAYQGFAKQNYTMLDNLKIGYGGTKTEMERLLKDAQKLTGVKYDINNLTDVYSAIHAVQKELGITGATAKEASTTFSGSFAAMKSAFANFIGGLAIGQNVIPALMGLLDSVRIFVVGNLLPMIGTIIQSVGQVIFEGVPLLFTNLVNGITTGLPGIIENGGRIVSSLIQGIITNAPILYNQFLTMVIGLVDYISLNFPTFLEKGKELINNILSGISEVAPLIFNEMVRIVGELISKFTENLPIYFDKGMELVNNILKGITENAPKIFSEIVRIIGDLISKFSENLPMFLEKGKELISSILSGIIKHAPVMLGHVLSLIQSLIKIIIDNLPMFLQKGIEIIVNLGSGLIKMLPDLLSKGFTLIRGLLNEFLKRLPEFLRMGLDLILNIGVGLLRAIPGLISKIPTIIGAVIRTFGTILTGMISIGADIVKGLWRGILSVKDWILSKIGGFVNNIIGGIKGFFGIKSPSRVMANQVGKFIPSGLAMGIENNLSPVSKAMDEMGAIATRDFQSTIGFGLGNLQEMQRLSENGIVSMKDELTATFNANLVLGDHTYKVLTKDISNEQSRQAKMELAY